MTLEEANNNVGQPFKWIDGGQGLTGKFDTIRKVCKGWVYGDFIAAPVEDCRFRQEQPDHLKKHNDENT